MSTKRQVKGTYVGTLVGAPFAFVGLFTIVDPLVVYWSEVSGMHLTSLQSEAIKERELSGTGNVLDLTTSGIRH